MKKLSIFIIANFLFISPAFSMFNDLFGLTTGKLKTEIETKIPMLAHYSEEQIQMLEDQITEFENTVPQGENPNRRLVANWRTQIVERRRVLANAAQERQEELRVARLGAQVVQDLERLEAPVRPLIAREEESELQQLMEQVLLDRQEALGREAIHLAEGYDASNVYSDVRELMLADAREQLRRAGSDPQFQNVITRLLSAAVIAFLVETARRNVPNAGGNKGSVSHLPSKL